MKLKRVTAFVLALLLPYMTGCKKNDEIVLVPDDDTKYGVTKEIDAPEEEEVIIQEKEVYDDQKGFVNIDQDLDSTYVEQYQTVNVLEKDNDQYLIETGDYSEAYVNENCVTLLPEDYVEVDISDQSLVLYKDNEEVLSSDIVTGKNSTPTDLGYYQIEYMARDVTLEGYNEDGSKFESFVSYWMPFNLYAGEGLHDATWRSEFGGKIYKSSGSHGCVNMPYSNAEELYSEVEPGTKVLVHK